MKFYEALSKMEENPLLTIACPLISGEIGIHYPKADEKMTEPYLYLKTPTSCQPWSPSLHFLLAVDWYIIVSEEKKLLFKSEINCDTEQFIKKIFPDASITKSNQGSWFTIRKGDLQ